MKTNVKYTEREERLIVAWCLIFGSCLIIANWAIDYASVIRPPYIIDLLFPAMLAITGVYILKKKIPEN